MQCNCSVDGSDSPECYTSKMRKARKEHKCGECDRTIYKGEEYEYFSGIWDGQASNYKTCLGCMRLRDDLCPDGFVFERLAEHIQECTGFDYLTNEWDEEDEDAL